MSLSKETDQQTFLVLDSKGTDTSELRNLFCRFNTKIIGCTEEKSLFENLILERPDLVVLSSEYGFSNLSNLILSIKNQKKTQTLPILLICGKQSCTYKFPSYMGWIEAKYEREELFLTTRALLRRVRPSIIIDKLSCGSFQLDQSNFLLNYKGTGVKLCKIDLCLLAPFFDAPNKQFERNLLRRLIFEVEQWQQNTRNLDFALARMRRNIRNVIDTDPVRSVRGIGYELARPEQHPSC